MCTRMRARLFMRVLFFYLLESYILINIMRCNVWRSRFKTVNMHFCAQLVTCSNVLMHALVFVSVHVLVFVISSFIFHQAKRASCYTCTNQPRTPIQLWLPFLSL